jgi:hypothetical protein
MIVISPLIYRVVVHHAPHLKYQYQEFVFLYHVKKEHPIHHYLIIPVDQIIVILPLMGIVIYHVGILKYQYQGGVVLKQHVEINMNLSVVLMLGVCG